MDRKDIVIIGLIAILAAAVLSAGVANGALAPSRNPSYAGMMGRSQYGGSMMGAGGGMMGSAGVMGSVAQGNYQSMYQYMQQHWNSTAMPHGECYEFMQHYWNST